MTSAWSLSERACEENPLAKVMRLGEGTESR